MIFWRGIECKTFCRETCHFWNVLETYTMYYLHFVRGMLRASNIVVLVAFFIPNRYFRSGWTVRRQILSVLLSNRQILWVYYLAVKFDIVSIEYWKDSMYDLRCPVCWNFFSNITPVLTFRHNDRFSTNTFLINVHDIYENASSVRRIPGHRKTVYYCFIGRILCAVFIIEKRKGITLKCLYIYDFTSCNK